MSTAAVRTSDALLGGHLQYTDDERRNLATCEELFSILFNHSNPPSAAAVAHLCTADSQFVGPSTMPGVVSIADYGNAHGQIMKCVTDFSLRSYDVVLAKANFVVFRYTGCGHHNGEPYKGVPASGKLAVWHGTDIFQLEPSTGRIQTLIKEFDKASMWTQLGQPTVTAFRARDELEAGDSRT